MRVFNKFLISSGCPHCRQIIPVVRKLIRKLRGKNKIEIINTRNTDDFNTCFFQIEKRIKFNGTPNLTLGKINGGKIVEDIRIPSAYIPEVYEAFLNGYLNKDFSNQFKEERKNE